MPTFECLICQKKVTYASPDEAPFRPFCCKRCKAIDLGRWLNEEYRIIEELPADQQNDQKPDTTDDDTPPE